MFVAVYVVVAIITRWGPHLLLCHFQISMLFSFPFATSSLLNEKFFDSCRLNERSKIPQEKREKRMDFLTRDFNLSSFKNIVTHNKLDGWGQPPNVVQISLQIWRRDLSKFWFCWEVHQNGKCSLGNWLMR